MNSDQLPIVVVVLSIISVILFFVNRSKQSSLDSQIERGDNLYKSNKDFGTKLESATAEALFLNVRNKELEILIAEKSKHFPWLATAFADYVQLIGDREERALRNKSRPARVSADKVKAATARARDAEYKFRKLKYRLDFLEKSFSWISELTGDTLEQYLESLESRETATTSEDETDDNDPVRNFLSPTDYQKLVPAERNQRALDGWVNKRNRPNWELGRMYERFIGFSYEQEGYKVDYFGATEGLEDLGRDLIVRKNGIMKIVQCKYWSKDKLIHEKHIFQLFGSVIEYIAKSASRDQTLQLFDPFAKLADIQPVFVTSTRLSEHAAQIAKILKVEVRELVPLGTYPLIKCNVAKGKGNGEKVYHLPFDQQYDKTRIEPEFDEFYANTVKEAEDRGFRRAYRWRPSSGD